MSCPACPNQDSAEEKLSLHCDSFNSVNWVILSAYLHASWPKKAGLISRAIFSAQ